jgi:hypothetical protein
MQRLTHAARAPRGAFPRDLKALAHTIVHHTDGVVRVHASSTEGGRNESTVDACVRNRRGEVLWAVRVTHIQGPPSEAACAIGAHALNMHIVATTMHAPPL